MRTRSTLLGLLLLLGLALAFAAVVPACTDEGEGQPCSVLGVNNGSDECQNGYQCTPASQLNPPVYTKDVCCPGDRALAVTQICSLPKSPFAEAGADGGLPVPPVLEAGADAADGGSEAAPIDAPADVADSATEGG